MKTERLIASWYETKLIKLIDQSVSGTQISDLVALIQKSDYQLSVTTKMCDYEKDRRMDRQIRNSLAHALKKSTVFFIAHIKNVKSASKSFLNGHY